MKHTSIPVITALAAALLTIPAPAQNLVQRWANTSINLGSGNNGLGYSPVSGNVIASVCASATAGNATIYQLKLSDGTSAGGNLSVPSGTIAGGTYVIGGLAVASDGVIYACNYAAAGSTRIYKWANEGATPTMLCSFSSGGVGSLGKNLTVYGTGNNAVFLLTSTTTGPLYVYYDTSSSSWKAKTLTVSSGTCQSTMTFVNWGPTSCTFVSKNTQGGGYKNVFDSSAASPITVTQTGITGTGWASGTATIQNVAYDPVTGLYGTHCRDNGASPYAHTVNTWATGGAGTSGTLIAPVAETAVIRNSTAADGGAIGATCWATNTGVFLDMPAVAGFGLVCFDTTAYKRVDTTPAGPVQVASGSTASFSVVSGGSQLNYQWQVDEGSGFADVSGAEYSGGNSPTLTINPVAAGDAGTYQCVVSQPFAGGTTWTSAGAILRVCDTVPTAFNVTGGGVFCSGGLGVAIGIDGSETGKHYQVWRNNSGTPATVGSSVAGTGVAIATLATATVTDTYTVVATDDTTSCTATMTGSKAVTANPLPTAYNVTGGGAYCSGGSGVVIGVANSQTGKHYQVWRNNGGTPVTVGSAVAGTGSGITTLVTATVVDTYTVVATDDTTSCTANMTGSKTVTVNPLPTAYNVTGGGSYCAGGSGVPIGLDGSQTGKHYQVYRNGGATAVGTSVAGTGSGIVVLVVATVADTYTVVATDDTTSCTANMTGGAMVGVNAQPTASVNSVAICMGASTLLTATSSASSPSYLWSPGGATTPSITVSPASTTTYTVTVTDGVTGCANSGSGTVTVNPTPTADAGADQTVCAGSAVAIGGSPTASGGTGPYTYSWSPTTGLSDATAANPTATLTTAGMIYTVTVTDHNGCTAQDSVTLSIISHPEVLSTTASGSDVTLIWSSLAGWSYRVQYTTDLPSPPETASWTDLTPDVPATGATASYEDHAGAAAQRFYRVLVVCP